MAVIPQKFDETAKKAYIQYTPAYVSELRQKTGYYLGYVPNEYADQPTQANFYEVLRKDPEIARCNNLLSLMAAGDRLKIKTENPKLAKILKLAVGEIRNFIHVRKSLIEKCALFGLGVQKKAYETVEWLEYPGTEWQVVTAIQEVDRRRIRIERDREDKNKMFWTMWHPEYDAYMILDDRNVDENARITFQDYIWLVNDQEELFPYFEGLGETLYMLAFIKSKCMQYWGELCESWAKPFLVASIDLLKSTFNANMGSGFVSAQKHVEDLIATFEKARARHICVIDKSDEITYHEKGTAGVNMVKELLEYCDKKIQFMFFGTELATQSGNYGSYKLGLVHKQETDTIIGYYRKRLEEALQRDLLYDFCWMNRNNLWAMGIGVPRPSEIQIEIRVDTEQEEQMAQGQGQQGMIGKQQ